MTRRLFAVPVDAYFDDYMNVDRKDTQGSAQRCLDAVHNAVRFVLEVLVHNSLGLSFWQSMGFHGRSLTMVKGDGP